MTWWFRQSSRCSMHSIWQYLDLQVIWQYPDLPADPAVLVLQLRAGGLTPLKVVPQVPVVECGQVPLRKGLGPEAQHLVDLRDVGAGIQLHPWSKNTKDSSVNCWQSLESHYTRHSLWFTNKWRIESATYHSKYIQSLFLTLHCMHPSSNKKKIPQT